MRYINPRLTLTSTLTINSSLQGSIAIIKSTCMYFSVCSFIFNFVMARNSLQTFMDLFLQIIFTYVYLIETATKVLPVSIWHQVICFSDC